MTAGNQNCVTGSDPAQTPPTTLRAKLPATEEVFEKQGSSIEDRRTPPGPTLPPLSDTGREDGALLASVEATLTEADSTVTVDLLAGTNLSIIGCVRCPAPENHHAASPHRLAVSPIPENFFEDAAWEDVLPSRSVQPVTRSPPPRPQTPLPSRPTGAPALLEIVSDFSFQSRVLEQITQLLDSGSQQRSLLSVQPTSSGKGAYAPAMSKYPSRCPSFNLCRL
jgi:hypothetical protein